jgi:hypothetical protein
LTDPAQLWADPRLIYTVAAAAVALLLVTIWLFKRQRRQGRQAGMICLVMSIALHAALLFLVPLMQSPNGGSSTVEKTTEQEAGVDAVSFSTFDPDMQIDDTADDAAESTVAPLPVANLSDLLSDPVEQELDAETPEATETTEPAEVAKLAETVPESLASSDLGQPIENNMEFDSALDALLDNAFAEEVAHVEASTTPMEPVVATTEHDSPPSIKQETIAARPAATSTAPKRTVVGDLESDFANRVGEAKTEALQQTGGNEDTEAAVEAALKFLANSQRADGAWDPRASGAGIERAPLGMNRNGAGSRAESAITGLALLTMIGSGHTHQHGEYADNVYRGLAYLIKQQKPDGSMAGQASVYAATYSHGMASLAMCEAAAITQDASALQSAQRALTYTKRLQHPTTGGWRYTSGDPGDLSQLGWQAMVLDAGHRAKLPVDRRAVAGVERFLRSVRMGSHGGLATYRRGEAPSRTMTAEALATRLLIGEQVPSQEIEEAERYLLQRPPGVGQDNYYYWYYATLALHQLQDDAWKQWNEALKKRLLATQRSDGSWPSDTLWGGYGGTVYTTSMAALCLETYYRHAIRNEDRIANTPYPDQIRR